MEKNKIKLSVILIALLIMCSFTVEAKGSKKTVMFNVMMHCHDCQNKIEKGLAYEPGILNLKTDLKQNCVYVTYNENKTNVGKIMLAFKKIGYVAYPVGENCSSKKGGCLNNPAIEVNTMK